MASSGTINGTQSGTRPYLRMLWNTDQTDTSRNRTRVRIRLYLVAPYRVVFSASKTGDVDGNSFTYTGGMNGTGTKLLRTQYIWINHNSNGKGSKRVRSRFNIAISYSGSRISTLSVTGTINPNDIPRASTLGNVSFSTTFSHGATVKLNLSISKKHSSYWHVIAIWDGSSWLTDWGYTQSSPSSVTLTSSAVNKILNLMRSSTSKKLTVRLGTYTRNGGGKISHVDKSITAKLGSGEKPSISSTSASISGSGWDKGNNVYVQNLSRVTASFSHSLAYGTTVAREEIVVAGDKTHNGRSITSGVLRNSGSVRITYRVVDSRGREASSTRDIDVLPYTTPKISSFLTDRVSGDQEKVSITRKGSWSTLSGKNKLNYLVRRRSPGGSWTTLQDSATGGTTGSFNSPMTDYDRSETLSFEYQFTITDSVGNSTTSSQSVSTAKTILSLNKDIGVGIGKIHERGELDVEGQMYVTGELMLEPEAGESRPALQLHSGDKNGHSYIGLFGADGARKGYMGIPNATSKELTIFSEQSGGGVHIKSSGGGVYINNECLSDWVVEHGSNYTKWKSGKAEIWGQVTMPSGLGHVVVEVKLPITMSGDYYTQATWRTSATANTRTIGAWRKDNNTLSMGGHKLNSDGNRVVQYYIIGRWK